MRVVREFERGEGETETGGERGLSGIGGMEVRGEGVRGTKVSGQTMGRGGGIGGEVGAHGGSGGMLKSAGKGVCCLMLMMEEESLASKSGESVLEWVRWDPVVERRCWVWIRVGNWDQRSVSGERRERRSSFSARIADRWRRRRRRGSMFSIASRDEGRTLGLTPMIERRACFWAFSRREEVLGEMEDVHIEPHSRTGRIQEQ